MSSSSEQVKERLNIVEVIGQYVKLTKNGKNYKGLSPFKKEKTPSFYVSPDKGMYYDFSSNKGGDVFTFIQEIEGVDFKGALALLAARAGVEITHESKEKRSARDRLYDVLEEATRFFETKLEEHTDAIEYLTQRGLERETMRRFRIGFAPVPHTGSWTILLEHLTRKGFSERECELAGLVKKGEKGRVYDRFRSRIMFPIADTSGRIVAFSGRIFGEAAEDKENAKYLNSPETELFDKGRILYGYDKAKPYVRKYDFVILVEGQMDLVMSHQVGYGNAVAVSGTGLTADHLALVGRLTKRLVLAFDEDSAGVASTGRAAALALRRSMDVKVLTVPTGKDPADCIKESPDLWREAIKTAVHVVEYFLRRTEHDAHLQGDSRKQALAIRDTVLPYVARIMSAVDQAHFIRVVAERLGVPDDAVREEVRTLVRNLPKDEVVPEAVVEQAERPVTALVPKVHNRRAALERSLAGLLFWQHALEAPSLTEADLASITTELDIPLAGLLARYEEERTVLAFQTELEFADEKEILRLANELLHTYARERLLEERARLSRLVRDLEREGKEDDAQEALTQFTQLAQALEALDKKRSLMQNE